LFFHLLGTGTKNKSSCSNNMKTLFSFIFAFISIGFFAQQSKYHMSNSNGTSTQTKAKNVLGSDLESCCFEPLTGYFRDGYCRTDWMDSGTHTVCAIMTEDFLTYTKSKGNDLSTPFPQFNFPGLNVGDKWCLCASRWLEAHHAGHAPNVNLNATHEKTLSIVDVEILKTYAVENK